MRKNLLVAGLLSLCVIGMTGCSRDENKAADEPAAPATAMTQEQNQIAAPAPQSADNSSMGTQATPDAAQSSQVVADSNTTTTTTTTGTDSDTTASGTAPAGSASTDTTTQTTMPSDSNNQAGTTTTTQSN